ncbi:MAG: thiol reductant ABC exporter subunit CydC [Ignavibacteriales bacterium]|nr:thiol reductant ABC exporter subunit CydC [Ignavibacteriales bacterium]
MIKIFIKIVSLGKEYKFWMLLAALLGFFTVGSGIGLMMTSSYLIAKAALQTPIYQLQVAIVGVRFFGISRGVFRYLERYISHNVTFKLLAKFRVWFFKSLIPIVPSKTIDLSSGDLLSRSIEDIESTEHIFVRVISPPFIFAATSVLMFGLLSIFSLAYSIIFILMFFTSAMGIPLLTFLLSNKTGKEIISLKSKLKEFSIDSIQGISELIFYNQKDKWINDFDLLNNKLIKAETRMNNIQALHESLTGLTMNLTVIVMLLTAIPDVTNGILEGVYLSVISIGIMASFEAVAQIPQAFQYLGKSTEAGNRLFEITETTNKSHYQNTVTEFPSNYNLRLDNISFSYNNKTNALENISLSINSGEKVAIVGASGAGKSTIVNILTKLWDYNSGDIFLGSLNYKNISDDRIRNIISVVPQKVHLFTGTIKENLLVAKPDATDDELMLALSKVNLETLVNSLPEKLNTNIGELGKKLSGGESKRLTIARALLKDSQIIIFDEINSHVDNLTEKKILETVLKIPKDKSILFITHRIVQMEMFDKVIVFSNGKIVESGLHQELLEQNGYYKKLIDFQNQKITNTV